MPATIAFIGLGAMGAPMAANLLDAGFTVRAFNRSPEKAKPLADKGATVCASVAEAVKGANFVVSIVADDEATRQVMLGADGVVANAAPGTVIIDSSPNTPTMVRELAAAARARGIEHLDAPVSGSVAKAKTGTLAIMVGADDAAFAKDEPVLKGIGEALNRTGVVGSAHAMKALNNFVYAAGLLATAEALRMGEALGLDLGILTDVMNASSGRNIATETKSKQEIITGRYAGGFMLGLMRKDLDTAGSISEATGVAAPSLQLCRQLWAEAVGMLGPNVDNTQIHLFLNRWAPR
jgi:3-hydroxyisobutyrate dehydrogenase